MTGLVVWAFEGLAIRSVTDALGQPWFVGKDVCRALGLRGHRVRLSRLPDDERRGVTISYPPVTDSDTEAENARFINGIEGVTDSDPLGKNAQLMNVINEPGVYRLVMSSSKPAAERFKRWLFRDVLPQIRETGAYVLGAAEPGVAGPEVAGPQPAFDLPEDAALWLAVIREARMIGGKAAAVALWGASPLPALPGVGISAEGGGADGSPWQADVALWVSACLEPAPGVKARSAELYAHYRAWCAAAERSAAPHVSWGRAMSGLGIRRLRDEHRCYVGVRLVSRASMRGAGGPVSAQKLEKGAVH